MFMTFLIHLGPDTLHYHWVVVFLKHSGKGGLVNIHNRGWAGTYTWWGVSWIGTHYWCKVGYSTNIIEVGVINIHYGGWVGPKALWRISWYTEMIKSGLAYLNILIIREFVSSNFVCLLLYLKTTLSTFLQKSITFNMNRFRFSKLSSIYTGQLATSNCLQLIQFRDFGNCWQLAISSDKCSKWFQYIIC